MAEIYKPIPEYDNYEISNYGNIRSTKHNIPKLLKYDLAIRNHTKYFRVTLCKDGKTKRFQVHQLVARVFIPNPDSKPHINHIDNNGINNHVSNLEWCTHTENMQHSANQGRQNEVRKLGCEAARQRQDMLMTLRLHADLGDRYIGSKIENNRRYITYRCNCCNYIYTARSDHMPIKRNGICNSCFKEKDIV